MSNSRQSSHGLEHAGLNPTGKVNWNLTPPRLYEVAVRRGEATIARGGPLVTLTGVHTGRSPKDKLVAQDPDHDAKIWWGDVNKPISPAHFDQVLAKIRAFMNDKELFVQDCYAGADEAYRLNVRVVNTNPYPNLFARNMFIRPDPADYPQCVGGASHCAEC